MWSVEVLEGAATEEIEALPQDMKAKLLRIMEYIRTMELLGCMSLM